MFMTAVTKTNLNSAPYNAVLSILESSSYIQDPRRKTGLRNRKFIYRHEPETTSFDFSLYPLIVCKPATKTKSRHSADQTTQEILWTQKIIVKTLKEGSGANKDDVGVDDMLLIMDGMDEFFESTAVRSAFLADNLNFMDITTLSVMQEIVIDGKVIYETVYEITYRSRLVVK